MTRVDTVFVDGLQYAMKLAHMECSKKQLENLLGNIHSYEDIKKVAGHSDSILYPWLPALIYDYLGYYEYINCDLNVDCSETYVLFRPKVGKNRAILKQISDAFSCVIKEHSLLFTKELAARLYGGFPWFTAYYKTCNTLQLWNEKAYAYKIIRCDGEGCVSDIVHLKNIYRAEHEAETTKMTFESEAFPGIVHSFHSPNCIENGRHCQAIEAEIRKAEVE